MSPEIVCKMYVCAGQASTAALGFSRMLHISLLPKFKTAEISVVFSLFFLLQLICLIPSWQDCPRVNAMGMVGITNLYGSEIICVLADISFLLPISIGKQKLRIKFQVFFRGQPIFHLLLLPCLLCSIICNIDSTVDFSRKILMIQFDFFQMTKLRRQITFFPGDLRNFGVHKIMFR